MLAIDFGTTATAAAVREADGTVSGLVLANGAATMPSAVFADAGGHLLVGLRADQAAGHEPDRYEPTPKRRVGRSRVLLGDKGFRPAELIAAVYEAVITEAIRQHDGTPPVGLVLTHPVAWAETRLAVLREAARLAGENLGVDLPAPDFMPEPVAAAAHYALSDAGGMDVGALFAIYDLGGGTFDATALRRTDSGFDVLASGGIDPLGGFDFDARLFRYLGVTHIEKAVPDIWHELSSPAPDDEQVTVRRHTFQAGVRQLKEDLSEHTQQTIRLPGIQTPTLVTRDEFETLIQADLEATTAELNATVRRAGSSIDELAGIYRIGGASRIPLVGNLLDQLRRPVHVVDHPKTVVSLGAAARARVTETAPAAASAESSRAEPGKETPPLSERTRAPRLPGLISRLMRRRVLLPVAAVTVVIGLLIYGATLFGDSRPSDSNANRQPYIDAAINVATDYNAPTRDGIQRLLDHTSGELHNNIVSRKGELEAQMNEPPRHFSVDAAGVESLTGTTAEVLIASTLTGTAGVAEKGIAHIEVTKSGDRYEVSTLRYEKIPPDSEPVHP